MAGSPVLRRIRNRAERLRQRRWRGADYRSSERHIVMGGAPRSGTTILRKLLDRHPEILAGAETKLFVPAAFNLAWLAEAYSVPRPELEALRRGSTSQGAFIDAFAARVRSGSGKARWAEKTPQNIRHLEWVLAHFPGAAIVHIIRDGRDVICSMREHPDWRWVDGAWQKEVLPRALGWYAQRWLADTAAGMACRGDARYVEVRYEDLVADPTAALQAICEGVGVTADPAWLEQVTGEGRGPATSEPLQRPEYEGAVSAASVGRWRTDLSAAEQREVARLCGPRLRELGYEVYEA